MTVSAKHGVSHLKFVPLSILWGHIQEFYAMCTMLFKLQGIQENADIFKFK